MPLFSRISPDQEGLIPSQSSKMTIEIFVIVEELCDQSVKPDDRSYQVIISTIEKRFSIRRSSIYSLSVQNYVVGFDKKYQPCWWCTCSSFRMKRSLCKHYFVVINSGMVTFNDLSLTLRLHSSHVINNDLFHNDLVYDANNTVKKTRHKNCCFLKKMHSVREKSPNHN